ncbi:MAG: prostaglandin-endoperoxide synthase 2 [Solirubrobacteraceae bacterium]|nr:prostaglandin-endoperoxide synthase 2 [Solirubrobacteraceae bacterium]
MADTRIPEIDDWVPPAESNGSNNAPAAIRSLLDAVPPVTSAVGKVLGAAPIPGLPSSGGGRSTEKDGLNNQIEAFLTTHGAPIWSLVQAVPPVRSAVNKLLTNSGILKFPTRPEPLTTMAPYTSWSSVTDRTFSARHLPPAAPGAGLPDIEEFEPLYHRDQFIESPKSTVLFSYFAQWFTDGFLRMDRNEPPDLRKNQSNHEIDLTNLYGLTRSVTDQLRAHEGGLLKSQLIKGEEYPPYLYSDGKQKAEFSEVIVLGKERWPPKAENKFFAMGSDTSNLQIGFVMHNVLFLREHNRIARLLQAAYPTWDDERLFETARNVMIVLLIKVVIEEYINHITPYLFKLRLEPRSFPNERWYRHNWMATEFQLLYRWHSLVPETYLIGGKQVKIWDTLFNTEIVSSNGLGRMFEDASLQPAGQVGLKNTPPELWDIEKLSIRQGRVVELSCYNDYRQLAGFPRVTEFNQITGRRDVREELRRLYGHVDNIEFFVGLFAEDARTNSVLPGMIGRMVGLDAFSQVYTNPLLSTRIYNEKTFSPLGMEIIETTKGLAQILNRNVPERPEPYFVSLTRKGWKRA